MKELSIEEKAKRYDELKVTAQELEQDGCFDKITLFDLFPELKESEDERMRKIVWDILLVDSDEIREILDANNVLIQDVYVWLEKQSEKESVTCPICGWEIEKQGEQKPAWSEEDEKMLDDIIEASIHHCYLNITDINWLKSLRPQNKWKPSDKQLRQLELAIDYWKPNNTEVTTTLFKLWEDLKKLKAGKL